jgi:uracil-DNA glycosylase
MDIKEYQKICFREYKKDINLPSKYSYLYGNPISTLVPIEVTTNKIMVLGAYPSAKFFTIDGINDVPLYDNDSPFSNENYFDGTKVRNVPSGNELNEMLNKIGVVRKDCWITDLVKIFLFKKGHIKKYNKLGKNDFSETRNLFSDYAKKSMKWLEMEIKLAKPSVLITLGEEVGSVIINEPKKNFGNNYFNGKCRNIKIGDQNIKTIFLPHPGILIRLNTDWPKRFDNEISKYTKSEIKKILP